MDLAVFDQLGDDALSDIDGDREADPLGTLVDRGVDPNQRALGVDQRPPGVSGVDRGIGLQKAVKGLLPGVDRTVGGRNHAGGHGI